MGAAMGVLGRVMGTRAGLDPLNLKDKPNTPRARPRELGQGQVQGLGLECLMFNPHSHLCAKRDGG